MEDAIEFGMLILRRCAWATRAHGGVLNAYTASFTFREGHFDYEVVLVILTNAALNLP